MSCSNECKQTPAYTHTLTVERPLTTAEANGQVDKDDDDNWTAVRKIRARFTTATRTAFTTKSGREVPVGNILQAIDAVVIEAPFTTQANIPTPKQRLRLGTRVFNIIASGRINETGRVIRIEAMERKS